MGVFSFLDGAILMFVSENCRLVFKEGVAIEDIVSGIFMLEVFKSGVFKHGVFEFNFSDDLRTFLTFEVAGALPLSLKLKDEVLGFLEAAVNTGTVWLVDINADVGLVSVVISFVTFWIFLLKDGTILLLNSDDDADGKIDDDFIFFFLKLGTIFFCDTEIYNDNDNVQLCCTLWKKK